MIDQEFDEALSRSLPDHDIEGPEYPVTAKSDFVGIGEMAREFGTTPRALRFYENKGLLSPLRQGAVRLYSRADRERLTLVLKAKGLGFTLTEIRQMIAEPAGPAEPRGLAITRRQCFDQIKHLEQRKREIETALAELRRTYSSFYARLAATGA
jgi:DNA-binding transcriptional MerR regulator